jgi:hypothetical protein
MTYRVPNLAVLSTGFVASFAVLVRVLSSALVDAWSGVAAAALATAAVAAFAIHAWNLATGRGWRHSLEGESRCQRLAALEALRTQGRIRPAEYLEERDRLLRSR